MNKYYRRLRKRPLSTLSEEEYDMLREMGMLWVIYPSAYHEFEDISFNEFKAGKYKRKK